METAGMTKTKLGLALGVSALAIGAPFDSARAADFGLEEVRAGLFYHSAYTGFLPTGDHWDLSRLESLKFSALFASPELDAFAWIGAPRPEIGATLNLKGRENIVHANLNWRIPLFETPLYLELGFGAALTDGALQDAASPSRSFGCALNFYEAAGIGAHIGDTMTLTLRYEHTSNADLCAPNEGLSNLGLMIGWTF